MAQTSILGRMGQLVRANINSILDGAEDPEKMLNQMVIDYTNNIREAEEAVAQTIGNLRLLEDDAKEAREASVDWGAKAKAASRKADDFRAAGNTAEADKFDNLAKIALGRQITFEEQVKTFDTQIATAGRARRQAQGRAQRDADPSARSWSRRRTSSSPAPRWPRPRSRSTESMKSVNVMDPTSEVARFEEKIRHEEAKARGMAEVAASSLDAQFETLDEAADDLEVEARLAALKGGS